MEAFTNIGPDHVTTYRNVQDFMKMEALIGAIHYYVSTYTLLFYQIEP